MSEIDDAKKTLKDAANKEVELCRDAIQEALRSYDCEMVPVTSIIGGVINGSFIVRKKQG